MRYGQKRLRWRKSTLTILAFWLPGLLLGQDTSAACVGAPGFDALDFSTRSTPDSKPFSLFDAAESKTALGQSQVTGEVNLAG